jgi:hypothetical protein
MYTAYLTVWYVSNSIKYIIDFHVSQDVIVFDFEGCQILSSVQILKQDSNFKK